MTRRSRCYRCRLPLSDPESVARGIGPVCQHRLGGIHVLTLFDLPEESFVTDQPTTPTPTTDPSGTAAEDVPQTADQMLAEQLEYAQRHHRAIAGATGRGRYTLLNHVSIYVGNAMAAYVLAALIEHAPDHADQVAADLHELADDGQELSVWLWDTLAARGVDVDAIQPADQWLEGAYAEHQLAVARLAWVADIVEAATLEEPADAVEVLRLLEAPGCRRCPHTCNAGCTRDTECVCPEHQAEAADARRHAYTATMLNGEINNMLAGLRRAVPPAAATPRRP